MSKEDSSGKDDEFVPARMEAGSEGISDPGVIAGVVEAYRACRMEDARG